MFGRHLHAFVHSYFSLVKETNTRAFYIEVIYKKEVLECSKSYENSVLDFLDQRKSINSYLLSIPFFTQAHHLFDLNCIYFLY